MVLDSVGIGGAPDAGAFGDDGSATLQHTAEAVGGIALPNLGALGLGRIVDVLGVEPVPTPSGAFGAMVQTAAGKDTTTGHWEMVGVILDKPFPTYPQGFPQELVEAFEAAAGVEVIGNRPASGTAIIEELGSEHIATGKPILYTSADSVWQLAAHVETVALERLYELCRTARALLTGEHEVARVIARPFRGTPGAFERTPDRRDFAVPAPRETVLDGLVRAGLEVRAVGKVADIFAGRGVTAAHPVRSNDEGVSATMEELRRIDRGLVFSNLVDFDQAYGHRNDPKGYALALEAFDARLPELVDSLGTDDLLVITADHGNDPTTQSTDHSRERVPFLAGGPRVVPGTSVGERSTFADLGATITDLFEVKTTTPGESFAKLLLG